MATWPGSAILVVIDRNQTLALPLSSSVLCGHHQTFLEFPASVSVKRGRQTHPQEGCNRDRGMAKLLW